MTLQEAIEARHSVRAYKELPLAEDVVKVLKLYPNWYIIHNNYVSLHPLRYNNCYEFIRTH